MAGQRFRCCLQVRTKRSAESSSPVLKLVAGSSACARSWRSLRDRVSSAALTAARSSLKKWALASCVRSFSAMVTRASGGYSGSTASESADVRQTFATRLCAHTTVLNQVWCG